MKIIDVTLRDGGFVSNFNWNLDQARRHLEVMDSLGIHIIELGYWKQNAKSNEPFYCMNEDFVERLTSGLNNQSALAIMIDYHYCTKDLAEYPKKGKSAIEIIRITSRKEDFSEALKFARALKEHTGLKISFQIINSTNYSSLELREIAEALAASNALDMVAFADSHGNLNMSIDGEKYDAAIKCLTEHGIKWGFHLHDHTGRANHNYWLLKEIGCNYIDASVNGLGKGGGNLKLEEIVVNEAIPKLLSYMVEESDERMRISKHNAFNLLTARHNVTDNYRNIGIELNLTYQEFARIVSRLEGIAKDTYSAETFMELARPR